MNHVLELCWSEDMHIIIISLFFFLIVVVTQINAYVLNRGILPAIEVLTYNPVVGVCSNV